MAKFFSITNSARRRFSDGRNRTGAGSYPYTAREDAHDLAMRANRDRDAGYQPYVNPKQPPQQPHSQPYINPYLPPTGQERRRTTSSANFVQSVKDNNRSADIRALGHLQSLPASADPLVNARREGMILDKADRTGIMPQPYSTGLTAPATSQPYMPTKGGTGARGDSVDKQAQAVHPRKMLGHSSKVVESNRAWSVLAKWSGSACW